MIVTQTPVRLSLFGGNTDFKEYYIEHGGSVLTAAIDKYVYCIVKERFDDLIIVNYSDRESVTDVNDLKHDIAREALKLMGIEKGIEISFMADIPGRGTGLGSSSSIAVGLLNALHTHLGQTVSANRLAKEAIQIEIDILKNPIGVQDQYAAAFGGFKTFEFTPIWGKVRSEEVDMSISDKEDFDNSLTLFYTGVTRKANDILSEFNVSDNIDGLYKKKRLVEDALEVLKSGDLGKFGNLLNDSWNTKRKDNTLTTNDEIDSMYDLAMSAGAIGGKLIGAGGGGFLLVMFPANKRAKIVSALKDYKEMPFRLIDFGSRVVFNIRS